MIICRASFILPGFLALFFCLLVRHSFECEAVPVFHTFSCLEAYSFHLFPFQKIRAEFTDNRYSATAPAHLNGADGGHHVPTYSKPSSSGAQIRAVSPALPIASNNGRGAIQAQSSFWQGQWFKININLERMVVDITDVLLPGSTSEPIFL